MEPVDTNHSPMTMESPSSLEYGGKKVTMVSRGEGMSTRPASPPTPLNEWPRLTEALESRQQTASLEGFIGLKEAAKHLSESPTTIYGRTSRREIPFYKLGGRNKFLRCELDIWMVLGADAKAAERIRAERERRVGWGANGGARNHARA